jgi:hypothetical protein
MNLPRLLNNYHDARLERVAIGPRRELTLFIRLDREWNTSILEDAVVRFGAIVNFADVERFFSAMCCDPARDFISAVCRLEPLEKGRWLLDLDGHEALVIQSPHCTEQKR